MDDTKQPWKVENGYVEVVPNAGDIRTKEKFGDVQLHVEWAAPAVVRGTSQNRGNSGIFLQGRYEVQVLDSFENPTYADGQAGAIYGQWPPLVNPVRKPGEWQTYDIVFEAPRVEGGKVVKPAYLTVFLNGVLLHHHKEAMGPTVHRALACTNRSPLRTHWSCRIISSRCGTAISGFVVSPATTGARRGGSSDPPSWCGCRGGTLGPPSLIHKPRAHLC